jgi:sugar lactone lactonase YvrE
MKTLFVTTARDERGEGGGLYALDVDVPGLPSYLFDPSIGSNS